ncbi:helix-turn-helix domain-containing protein [Paraburkholderia sp. GAS333]|uniref:helix-turn-helix domain-containing protein n=1 Tax=Paraburkholderia sp. GAS333 TaxID=3156279 RepID=UPI003D1F0AAB
MTETDNNDFDPFLRRRLAEHLRRLRLERQISQEALAEQCGFHRSYVSQVERCANNITLDNIQRLAMALGVDPIELLRP